MRNLLVIVALCCAVGWSLDVGRCELGTLVQVPLVYINGTGDDSTTASLCYDDTFLYVSWQSVDKEIISDYKSCNDPLWKEDVVQIFIATPTSYPTNYYEFEVSPSKSLFFADITNYNGDCSRLGTVFYDCALAEYYAEPTANGWDAWFKVRLDIIGRGTALRNYKVNILRVDYSSLDPIRYLTWQPTYADPACFHKPAYFQDIFLV